MAERGNMIGERLRFESERAFPPVSRLLVYDFDGPLCDPLTGQIDHRVSIQTVHAVNRGGTAMLINTGRDALHIKERLLDPLMVETGLHPVLRRRIVGSCEKGAVSISSTEPGGAFRATINERLEVPQDLREAILERVLTDHFFAGIVRAEPKLAMVTFSAKRDGQLDEFREIQADLSEVVSRIISELGYTDRVVIDNTANATDIQNVGTGKDVGMEVGVNEFRQQGVDFSPDCKVVCFGDSSSDTATIEKARELGFQLPIYIHVGDGTLTPQPTGTVYTRVKNTSGTRHIISIIENLDVGKILAQAGEHATRGEVDEVFRLLRNGISDGIDPRYRHRIMANAYRNKAHKDRLKGDIASAKEAIRIAAIMRRDLKAGRIKSLWESYNIP